MSKVARLVAALLLLAASALATQHRHLAPRSTTDCATCVFAASAGARAVTPDLPAPVATPILDSPSLPLAPGHAPAPLSIAPKNGPPRA